MTTVSENATQSGESAFLEAREQGDGDTFPSYDPMKNPFETSDPRYERFAEGWTQAQREALLRAGVVLGY